jgi:hypothetical protein
MTERKPPPWVTLTADEALAEVGETLYRYLNEAPVGVSRRVAAIVADVDDAAAAALRADGVGLSDDDRLLEVATRIVHDVAARDPRLVDVADRLTEVGVARSSGEEEYVERCPACGEPIDYCQGHGEIGDPGGCAILAAHDDGDHSGCHPIGCDDADAS